MTHTDRTLFRFPGGIPLPPVHPGKTIAAELKARGLSAHAAAIKMRIPANRLGLIVAGKRGISADTALRLSCLFGPSAEFWMNLQAQYDLGTERAAKGARITAEVEAA